MTAYNIFTVDFPARIVQLDEEFGRNAVAAEFNVTYEIMRLVSGFLLPYERIEGTSGAGRFEIDRNKLQPARVELELDKRFHESSYCKDRAKWAYLKVENFDEGPLSWSAAEDSICRPVHKVLKIIRHSLAHSNLLFGGKAEIEHVYFGSRLENVDETNKYQVVKCDVDQLRTLTGSWLINIQKPGISSAVVVRELG